MPADERLFDLDEVPEVPLFREPRRARGAQVMDARLDNDYPPEWSKCTTCRGTGQETTVQQHEVAGGALSPKLLIPTGNSCPDCLGMGSVKARVRLEAGHRCVRCKHPFMTKGDAKMLGVEPSPGHWSPCDEKCRHGAPIRWRSKGQETWQEIPREPATVAEFLGANCEVEAEWRIGTVHHADGDKANLAWWNLWALCQVDHLHIQNKVVLERVYPYEHSDWAKPYIAGYYAKVYLGLDLTREEVTGRLDELLDLERQA